MHDGTPIFPNLRMYLDFSIKTCKTTIGIEAKEVQIQNVQAKNVQHPAVPTWSPAVPACANWLGAIHADALTVWV